MKYNKKPILNFVYSYPYEHSLIKLTKLKLSTDHDQNALKLTQFVQNIWNKYEEKIIKLFEEMYKIEIDEKTIEAFISLILLNSYSHPLTISIKRQTEIKTNKRQQRAFIYTTIHELAHFFLYTRSKKEYCYRLYQKITKKKILKTTGENLHFLIQAVEFGIIAEIFGVGYADFVRNFVIKNYSDEYKNSAKALLDYNVPLNKTCLEYINKQFYTRKFINSSG